MAVEKESSEDKIKKAIQKTGLPTEMMTTKILQDRGWIVFNNYPYLDAEIKPPQIRTLDIRATKFTVDVTSTPKKNCLKDFSELYIECKKSEGQTWVFFVTDKANTAPSFAQFQSKKFQYSFGRMLESKWAKNTGQENYEKPSTILMNIPEEFFEIPYKIALSHQVVGGGKDDFFESKMQIVKALNYADIERSKIDVANSVKTTIVPMIVFEGGLFECYFEKDDIKTQETNYVRCLVYGLPNQEIPILIDVVTLKYLPEYLKLLEKELFHSKESLTP